MTTEGKSNKKHRRLIYIVIILCVILLFVYKAAQMIHSNRGPNPTRNGESCTHSGTVQQFSGESAFPKSDTVRNDKDPHPIFLGDRYCFVQFNPVGDGLLASHLGVYFFPDPLNDPEKCEVIQPQSNAITAASFDSNGDILFYDSMTRQLTRHDNKGNKVTKHVEIERVLATANIQHDANRLYLIKNCGILLIYEQCLFFIEERTDKYIVTKSYTPEKYLNWCGTAFATNNISCVDYSDAERLIALGLGSGMVVVLNINLEEVTRFRSEEEKISSGHFMTLFFTGEGDEIITNNGRRGAIVKWRAKTGVKISNYNNALYSNMLVSNDRETLLAMACIDVKAGRAPLYMFQIINITNKEIIWESQHYDMSASRIAFSSKVNVIAYSNEEGIFIMKCNE